jgi:glucose-1-phosphate thymidylyltransferase
MRDALTGELRPKVACHHLFEKFRRAGVENVYVILRDGKWDIPGYLGEGQLIGLHVAYIVVADTVGPPDTLDRAYSFTSDKTVAFGFPDLVFDPDDVFARLLSELHRSGCDVVLGLYPPAQGVSQADMVEVDETQRVKAIILKPQSSELTYTWICAVWTPTFSAFMHDFLERERQKSHEARLAYRNIDPQGDLPVGAVIKAAIEEGLRVCGLAFPADRYLDIGTPDNLAEAVRRSMAVIPR